MPISPETQTLVLDLLEWLAARPRPYAEVMDAWRTSCPRLTIWEDAVDEGLIVRATQDGGRAVVRVTPAGRAFLEAHRAPRQGPLATPLPSPVPVARRG